MSLVKAWLLFPESLNAHKSRKQHTGRHDFDDDYSSILADKENGQFVDKPYKNDVLQRVKRVLNILEHGDAYGSQDSNINKDFENDENFESSSNTLPERRQSEAIQNRVNSKEAGKASNWDNGIDIKVAKSSQDQAGYDIYHLLSENLENKKKSKLSKLQSFGYGESDSSPQTHLNAETKHSRESLHSGDLNNHNKGEIKNSQSVEADVLPGGFDATSNVKSKSVVVNKKQTPIAEGKSVVSEHSVKDHFYPAELHDARDLEQNLPADHEKGTLILEFSEKVKPDKLDTIAKTVQKVLWGSNGTNQKIIKKSSIDPHDSKRVLLTLEAPRTQYTSGYDPKLLADRINTDENLRRKLSSGIGITVLHAKSLNGDAFKLPKDKDWDEFAVITAIVGGSTLALIVASLIICSIKRRNNSKLPIELHKKEAFSDYEELCRTQMALNAASPGTMKAINADKQRHGLVNGQGQYTRKTWREEPLAYNMDISTGHVILAYLEEHLNDENKLSREWEALCNYKADDDDTTAGSDSRNAIKNRYIDVLPYDHTRVKLRETSNAFHSDYINANYITDSDPRNPSYIATQGPLDVTIPDFWQMIWEQGVVVIVNLTRLSDMGLPQCQRYWPEEGNEVYNTYQVHLISEHIWCDDYIVRSFYLKHLATQETRTVTQFHFLTWPDLSVPESAKPLLEFRRKVNKCYRGQACPIVVHCNNGVGRTGTYILIDMVLKKMIKGTKEIDIAATLEYLRDQRPDMVKTKAQFEFCLASIAEEVTHILSSLSN